MKVEGKGGKERVRIEGQTEGRMKEGWREESREGWREEWTDGRGIEVEKEGRGEGRKNKD